MVLTQADKEMPVALNADMCHFWSYRLCSAEHGRSLSKTSLQVWDLKPKNFAMKLGQEP